MEGRVNKSSLLLPFFRNLSEQTRFKNGCDTLYEGIIVEKGKIPAFQLEVPKGASVSYELYNGNTDEGYGVQNVTVGGFIDVLETETTAWLQHKYNVTFGTGDFCGLYYIILTVNGVKYYSDTFKCFDIVYKKSWYRLDCSNLTDTNNIIYQDGFIDRFFSEMFWDTPETVEFKEVSLNQNKQESVNFHVIKERQNVKIPFVNRFYKMFFKSLESLSFVQLYSIETGVTYTLKEVSVDFDDFGDCFTLVKLSFISDYIINRYCNNNQYIIIKNGQMIG